MKELRCIKCKKLLARYARCERIEIKCPRCGHLVSLFYPDETGHKLDLAGKIEFQMTQAAGLG